MKGVSFSAAKTRIGSPHSTIATAAFENGGGDGGRWGDGGEEKTELLCQPRKDRKSNEKIFGDYIFMILCHCFVSS